jgi:hypothetical protein
MQAIVGSNEMKINEVSFSDYAALVIGECHVLRMNRKVRSS